MTERRTVVIGGGITGCVAAQRIARTGRSVTLLERSPTLGGLVVSFEVGGTPLECFYHHVFPNEREILSLISELGLGPSFTWFRSSVGVLRDHVIWPFTAVTDLLRFRPLPLIDRIRTGIGSVRLTTSDWRWFDRTQAREWLRVATGDKAMDQIWGPLLQFKFGDADATVPASWMAARFRQRASARGLRGERLGYLRGGFRQLFDALALDLERLGVDVRTSTGVDRIATDQGVVRGVVLSGGEQIEADDVIYAGQLPALGNLMGEDERDPRWAKIGRLGAVCVIVEMDQPISDTYWTNVCDPAVPFGALIEHTNLVGPENYSGKRIAYLSRYFTADDPLATDDLDDVAEKWMDALASALPAFDRSHVTAVNNFRTPYAAPLVTLGYRQGIPPIATGTDGLYVATTAQIYPEDRGMNECVRLAGEAVDIMLSRSPARTSR